MPIYAYKCASCGHAKDVLQKMSDDPLTTCPACGSQTFTKQVTAAGFQLKGSGWYVTDFRDGKKAAASGNAAEDSASDSAPDASSASPGSTAPAEASAPAPAPAPASAPSPATPGSTAGKA